MQDDEHVLPYKKLPKKNILPDWVARRSRSRSELLGLVGESCVVVAVRVWPMCGVDGQVDCESSYLSVQLGWQVD